MALLINSDFYSRKSRRHGTSGRRRTTTSYDKYGYQIATPGSSYSKASEAVMHVLRVKPGVVVNFIEPPSHSSRSSRSRKSSHTHHGDHRSSHHSSRPHGTDDERDSPWEMTHSPHPRAVDIFDDGASYHSFAEAERPYNESVPVVRRSTPTPPSPHFHAEPQYYPSTEPSPMVRRSPPSPPSPHFDHESQYHIPPYESHRRESSAPIDIPIHSRSSDFAHRPPSTVSMSSTSTNSPPAHSDHALQPYYYNPSHTRPPSDSPIEISSGRKLSRSYEHHSHDMHSSESSSSPSTMRTVRFNEDPVQRSPAPVVRRKGWWNRRGDQLWDNDGSYAPASDHDKYPLDLQNYPEPGVGWMNEEGVQIDTKRRLVRKKPLKSALKKSSSL